METEMDFRSEDWNWKDIQSGLSEERKKRLEEVSNAINDGLAAILEPHGLSGEILEGQFSVGVQGDGRTYAPIVVLKGPFPGWDVISIVSTEISNTMPVGRVTYEI